MDLSSSRELLSPTPPSSSPVSSPPGSPDAEQPVQRQVVLYPWNQPRRVVIPLSFSGNPETPTLRTASLDSDIFDLDPRQCPDCLKPYSPYAAGNCGFSILMACPHTEIWADAENNYPNDALRPLLTDIWSPPFGNFLVAKHPLYPADDQTPDLDRPVLDVEDSDLDVIDGIIQRWVKLLLVVDGGLEYFMPNP
ncbi:hypothetical protein GGX14DRAFT_564784 [Mycena pura]|uniref:Uncharacterized protein n=1 Tax=Mycena pura TaxID=153505 RepID=A0AAD6YII5_9AGAR|nr:hypothetical protein GGX14DRAFT_570441 [Mycena pura]KAJ7212317.1 hypothetical protein GGX14DRAFT_564784 [Mycena pura]